MTLPHVSPIRPVRKKTVPVGREWRYEPKLDGFRGMLYVENGRGIFRSKTERIMPRFRELADALARELRVKSLILDGEIVVFGDHGPDFRALMRGGAPTFSAFDLVWLNGRDLCPLPYTRRKALLKRFLARRPLVGYVAHFNDAALFAAATKLDLEGIVAKRTGDPYSEETEWIKVKHAGYSQNEGRWELFNKTS
ncbi:MAG: bifunctional non-ous end joining protein LigD [Thermoanaerobaculia bacterium]|jgi:bifunctional non-homologous end joining protein LigD|nr:bifunctional non-ous end joining protein LigD [Thermoanaerobaculia bacterium]